MARERSFLSIWDPTLFFVGPKSLAAISEHRKAFSHYPPKFHGWHSITHFHRCWLFCFSYIYTFPCPFRFHFQNTSMCAHTPFPPLRGTTPATMKRKRPTLYIYMAAFLVLSMGYMRLQLHSSNFGPVNNCDIYIKDTISSDTQSSSHMLAAELLLQYPQHSTITCQLD